MDMALVEVCTRIYNLNVDNIHHYHHTPRSSLLSMWPGSSKPTCPTRSSSSWDQPQQFPPRHWQGWAGNGNNNDDDNDILNEDDNNDCDDDGDDCPGSSQGCEPRHCQKSRWSSLGSSRAGCLPWTRCFTVHSKLPSQLKWLEIALYPPRQACGCNRWRRLGRGQHCLRGRESKDHSLQSCLLSDPGLFRFAHKVKPRYIKPCSANANFLEFSWRTNWLSKKAQLVKSNQFRRPTSSRQAPQ